MKGFLTKEKITSLIIGAVAFIVVATLNTVIGNGMQTFLLLLWEQLLTSIKTNLINWLITSLIVVGSLGIAGYWWIQSRNLRTALETVTKMVTIDTVHIQLIPNLVVAQDLLQKRNQILGELLQETIKTLPRTNHNTYRGAILLPDGQDYLTMQINYNMSDSSVRGSRFYIGHDFSKNEERGIAGNVYLDREIRIGHIIKDGTRWRCDQDDFKKFDTDPLHPEFYSLINIPIIGPPPNERLGVLCMDSNDPKVFDIAETQKLLVELGRRVTATLSIYEQLLSSRHHIP